MSKEAAVKLPKGVDQETFDKVRNIIHSGFKAEQSPDTIKSAIFAEGIPFSKLSTLYSMITKADKLVADPKEVAAGIQAGVKNMKLNFKRKTPYEYKDLAPGIAAILDEVKGATETKVLTVLKKMFAEAEVPFPRKPAPTRGRIGVVAKTVINVFKKNSKASLEELEEALKPNVKSDKVANDYAKQYHKLGFALANGLSANEVLTVFSKEG
jgi:hypothetical protein